MEQPGTLTKEVWRGARMSIFRAFAFLLLSTLTVYVLTRCALLVDPSWIRFAGCAVLLLIALVTGLTGLAHLGIGVIRLALIELDQGRLLAIQATLQRIDRSMRSLDDRADRSDLSKQIACRQDERRQLRDAIREDIAGRQLDSAMALVKIMSQRYGYHEEAEEFREQIQIAREEEMDHKVATAISRLDAILEQCEWEKAASKAAKIRRQFPDSPRVKQLNRRVVKAREEHKHDLERQFLEAAQRDDVDRAMELLRELDRYLSEAEAEPFRETARGVIGKKRDNLGVQFKLAVHDKEWTGAVRVGEQLIREFPNTKMADEVRSMLDVLRERAASQQAARG